MKNYRSIRYWPLAWATIVLPILCAAGPASGEDQLATADRLRLRGRYAEAVEIYALPSAVAEDAVRAALGQAKCLLETGHGDEAAKMLAETAGRDAEAAAVHAELAHLALQRGDYATAGQHADKALAADKNQLLARWVQAELHRLHGRLPEAQDAYEWFIDYYNATDTFDGPESLRWIGLAAAQYARWTRNSDQFSFFVNELYPAALEVDENYWPAHLEAGLLFLEKYNRADALREITAALRINPNAAEAHAAKAALALQENDLDQASTSLDRALEIHPRLVRAHQFRAQLMMADFRPAEALQVLEQARTLNPRDETTLGQLAAVRGILDGCPEDPAGTQVGAIVDEAVGHNEHCGEFFLALAESLDLMRRFPLAERYYLEARRRMPQLVSVRGSLGMLYMRLGQEDKAAPALKASFEIDPFNVRVKNTLAVLEVLDTYQTLETDHFLIRYDPQHDALLAQYAAKYLEQEVYPQICGQLGYEPPQKSLFEIFNRAKNTSGHGWFSARMVGLPYIGTVGACAGQMVAMVSPTGFSQKFNWARVLRHEFVHVVNLQQTEFQIPHWFTEALAVHLEGYPRPPEWNEVLAKRHRAGELFDLGTLNRGFVRPADGEDWTLAYCQAELYAEYMIDRFGSDASTKLIAAYTAHRSTQDAIRLAFSVTLEDFEDGYRDHLARTVRDLVVVDPQSPRTLAQLQDAYQEQPDNADLAAELALAHLRRKANVEARRFASEAMRLKPKHQLASYVLARLYLSIGEAKRAEEVLSACLDEDARGDTPPQSDALSLLAALRLKAEDFAAASRWYQLGREHYPHDVKWLKALASVYLKSKNDNRLEQTLRELARLDADDDTIRKKLAQLALARQDYQAAADWANQALHIDVRDAPLHAWLAEACVGCQQLPRAIEEYNVAIELAPTQLAWRLALADTHVQAEQPAQARAVLEELLNIDADYPGADVLLESLPP